MENDSAPSDLLPRPHDPDSVRRGFQQWMQAADHHPGALAGWMREAAGDNAPARALMEAVFGNSPYLSRLLLTHPQLLHDFFTADPGAIHAALMNTLAGGEEASDDYAALMRTLRVAKGKTALLTALADISGRWGLEAVTAALSDLAETSLARTLEAILALAARRGDIADIAVKDSGIIVLGMGKLGARELNYSSDIDLILLYEAGRLDIKGRLDEQAFMSRLARDLATIMQERTPDGYVFRTDLRLRPDPASTPPAVSTDAACYYYESVGQNWERAAMIKARPVAGDFAAGERFLKVIAPFMWRRHLDFAAIADIHSIKRQMDSHQRQQLRMQGHNIKLGQGGIREIEFYTQIHQLIWGGPEPALRSRGTCETLARLAEHGLVGGDKETLLREAYGYLRKLEHRLQMVNDDRTHSLPENREELARIACFMGYDAVETFESDTKNLLSQVHDLYAASFKSGETQELGNRGNLVFTGVTHDPETLDTLRKMGYTHPEAISETVMGWHHGAHRATRSKRARELLTELMPLLLARLAETAHPDAAFLKFDEFLRGLPAGVQLFSLFTANPQLLRLIADIMGSAPTLAESLSRHPQWLDAVLYRDFYAALPPPEQLAQQLEQALADADGDDTRMERIRYFRNEKQFQAGVQMLTGMAGAETVSAFLSDLADAAIRRCFTVTFDAFEKTYGRIAGGEFAVLALGRLGGREMTFGSDIDLVFVYDAPDGDTLSDGGKAFSAPVYFNRLAQRFVGALAAMGRDGRLYEVDTRLRPSGAQGLLAVSRDTLARYFDTLAWTFEHMALTKARIIAGENPLKEKLEDFVRCNLAAPRDPHRLKRDAAEMRERVGREFGDANPWDIKYARGGLLDIDFIAQYLMLLHAPATPGQRPGSAAAIFAWLARHARIPEADREHLTACRHFLEHVLMTLRLCHGQPPAGESALPPGLRTLLTRSAREESFERLSARLIEVEASVLAYYKEVFNASGEPP